MGRHWPGLSMGQRIYSTFLRQAGSNVFCTDSYVIYGMRMETISKYAINGAVYFRVQHTLSLVMYLCACMYNSAKNRKLTLSMGSAHYPEVSRAQPVLTLS